MRMLAFHLWSCSEVHLQFKGLKKPFGIAIGVSHSKLICGRAYTLGTMPTSLGIADVTGKHPYICMRVG